VVTVLNGRLVDEAGHIDRLARSLREVDMPWPVSRRVLGMVMRELVRRNHIRNGLLYLQITRGVAPRDFKFPARARPVLVMTARPTDLDQVENVEHGVRVITIPDIRWKRRDIKSVALLPQVLGKQRAAEAGAFEAWQVDEDGFVTEGCSSNAWIVTGGNVLVTRHATTMILNGITRQSILRLAGEHGAAFEERAFTVAEAYGAREAFLTSATNFVMPVTRIDDYVVGDGQSGALTLALRRAYIEYAAGKGASA
jgi:D-alanine transaminase